MPIRGLKRKMNAKKLLTLFLTLVLTAGLSLHVTASPSGDTTDGTEMVIRPVMTDIPPKPQWLKDLEIKDPQPTMALDDIPSQFSWLDYGGNWMTPAKDQANCGSCWSFGALGAMEAVINIAAGDPDLDIDLSEQYVLACLSSAGSCSGGWMSEVFMYGQSTSSGSSGNGINGIIVEDCLPYQAVDWIPCSDKCSDWDYFTDPPAPDNNLFEITDWGVATFSEDDPNDWMTIKSWIMTYGPITCDIYQSSGLSSFANSHHDPDDVYENDDSGVTNHAQVICGWVDDPNIVNGGYWILKNSWGTSYGYNGFVNLAYGCNSLCTRDTSWVAVTPWPNQGNDGPGPGDFDMAVFADFAYGPEFPTLGEAITFTDVSDGDVTLREWDFNGDGVIDSTDKNPTHIYYQEGEYNVTLTVTNAWGLESTRTLFVEVREIWPPKVVINPDEFVDNELEVQFDGRFSYDVDGGRIASYYWDFDDGTTSEEASMTHVFPQADKIYNVELTVTDNDGASSTGTCVVKIDQTVPPETQIILDLGAEQSDWYRFNKKVKFEAEDWTGVADTFYRVNGGDWNEYQTNQYVLFSQEGNNQIDYYSVDSYGNEEQMKSAIIRIDKTLPTLDISVNGQKSDQWYTSDVSITMTGSDSLSGLDLIIYKVDAQPWREYNSGFTLADGTHRIWAYAIDNAGNRVGSDDPLLVYVDTGAPETTCQLVGDGTSKDFYQTVDVRLFADDEGSGVETIYYKLNSGFNEYPEDGITIDTPGDYTVEYYAVDALGNEESTKTRQFTVHPVNFKMILDQPGNFLYLFNIELFGLSRPIIIGPVDVAIEVDCFAGVCADITYVEFLVDGEVAQTDSAEPYLWRLDTPMMGAHEIGVKAIASDGSLVEEYVDAQVFIF
jgi:PKD repeat protein